MSIAIETTREREFSGTAESVGIARRWVKDMLAGVAADKVADIALCVSELATNAILHTTSGTPIGTYTIAVTETYDSFTVTVTSQDPSMVPLPRLPLESGHGLVLTAALADRFERTGTTSVAAFSL